MTKRLIIIFCLLWGCLAGAHASNRSYNECNVVASFVNQKTKKINTEFLESFHNKDLVDLYPTKAISLALSHLQAHCCNTKQLGPKLCPDTGLAKDYPKSDALYDHLVNIGVRRMDGIPENLYDQADLLDPTAVKWRKRLNKQSQSPDGAVPASILNEYNSMRKPTSDDIKATATIVRGGDVSQIKCDELRTYQSLQLRLEQQCDLSYCIMNDLVHMSRSIGSDLEVQGSQLLYPACQKLVGRRLQSEISLTKTIMTNQANRLTDNTYREYLQTYFVNNRIQKLVEKFVKFLGDLSTANAKYTEGTKTCN